jgi:hypothetical protein
VRQNLKHTVRNTLKMAQYDGYDDIRDLDTSTLHALLDAGDGSEQIWAAWALAVRLGSNVQPDLAQAALTSPSPGLRRHVIVVLAGLGERALLKPFALSDPDEQVRATACQYLMRTFETGDHDTIGLLREQLFASASLEVRLRILRTARPDLPPLSSEETSGLLADPEFEIRRLTANRIAEWYAPDQATDRFLTPRLKEEHDPRLLDDLVTYYTALGRVDALLAAIAENERAQQLVVLDLLVQRQLRVRWPDLAVLASPADDAIDLRLLTLLEDGAISAFPWLTRSLANRIRDDVEDDFRWRAIDRFAALVGSISPDIMAPGLEDDLAAIADDFDKQLEAWDADETGEDEDDEDYRDFFLKMRRSIHALLPH